MDKEMIERLAKAAYDELNAQTSYVGDYKAQGTTDTTLDGQFDLAEMVKAIVKAMREPTQAMLEAGVFINTAQSGVYSCDDVYQAMIDAITGAE